MNNLNNNINKKNVIEILNKFKTGIGLLILVTVLSFMSPYFLTIPNLLNVVRQVSIIAIISFGMTMVILTGGIDLSVGSMLAFSGAVTAGMIVNSGLNVFVAILIGLAAGTALGLFNGIAVAKAKLPAFIVTLAMMTVARGFTLIYTNGRPISGFDETFRFFGAGYLGRIPVPVIIMFILLFIIYILLKKTPLGRYIYAIGGNEKATKLSGINTDRIKIAVYALNGFLAAVSGIILTSRLNSAQPMAGEGYELDAIAAVVLGGTSLSGGSGGVVGTIIGALIIAVLNNGLNLLNVSSFYQLVAKGAVILLAVFLDRKSQQQ
ncbi:Ribose ABC transport system, permease protein RbsC (TC 3.A.1.2.1) [Halanaerobium saccharolyticum subsp. saccharolyticum DSM 6643]|uniref:Ribose ABC transport system, permease protein RbsC (TC 3.A.1.2.1) n=1 Tax=Halanaerobium saccharolyticum subsp. saccharolyticum DSM 6643 TaxID=1293054 RepID=M5DY28_9FIRM|nr:ribose ABC transporter permease [Halanaerobium saccharolyticum]CCU77845.1 Ribose ABC transport system, permease protein RbsC (TC 3.A.1.2.1) [Halanaerobium saccharolyticum subsp. saccharolyticum DSM 6643]